MFFLFEDMSEPDFSGLSFEQIPSIVAIMDGFSLNTTSFLESLFEITSLHTNIIGGGAGHFKDPQKPMIFNNDGFHENAAFIVGLSAPLNIAVSHGWQVVDGPFIVTQSEGKTLQGVDFKPALEVYKEIVEKDSGESFTNETQAELFKRYPLGIVKYNNEPILRDPIGLNENNELILAGELPQNSVITLLKSHQESLMEATLKASVEATSSQNDIMMMFECISRLEYLNGLSANQLQHITEHAQVRSIYGVVSIGEIANTGNHYINFLNKSCVMGGLCL